MIGFLAALCIVLALFLGRREVASYREQNAENAATDLFLYTRGRLRLRLTGVGALVAVAVTLMVWELLPPASPSQLSAYVWALTGAFLVLAGVGIADVILSARTANPSDLTRQGDWRGRKRSR